MRPSGHPDRPQITRGVCQTRPVPIFTRHSKVCTETGAQPRAGPLRLWLLGSSCALDLEKFTGAPNNEGMGKSWPMGHARQGPKTPGARDLVISCLSLLTLLSILGYAVGRRTCGQLTSLGPAPPQNSWGFPTFIAAASPNRASPAIYTQIGARYRNNIFYPLVYAHMCIYICAIK